MDRTDRLDTFLERHDLAAVWFARPNSLAWLTGGSNVVDAHAPVGVAAAGYDGQVRVVTDDIEAERFRDEELPSDVAVESYPWHATSLAEAVSAASPEPAAADAPVPGFERVDASPLRQPLAEADVENYRALGRDAASAVERRLAVVRVATTFTPRRTARVASPLAGSTKRTLRRTAQITDLLARSRYAGSKRVSPSTMCSSTASRSSVSPSPGVSGTSIRPSSMTVSATRSLHQSSS